MLQVAKVLKSNGVDGGILISAPQFDPQDFSEPVFIVFDGLPVPFFILSASQKGSLKYIVHLNDVETLEDAEELIGKDIYIEAEDMEQVREDFSGWKVLDNGVEIGTASDFEPIPGNPCLYVTLSDGKEAMIPLHEDFILKADSKRKELNLNLPCGILEKQA